jgi:hypothetical protein
VRVRQFELRLIGIALTVAWAVAALLVLFAYRPGGPLDLLVGVTFIMPVVIAIGGVAWPPLARGAGAFPLMVTLGVGSLLLLLPSIGGILNQLLALGSQTLLPSLEAAYPWLLALIGTSLFTGFGLARRTLGGTALRPRRLRVGVLVAAALTGLVAITFTGVAVANELALRELAVAPSASRFGPTDIAEDPPRCDGDVVAGPAARVATHLSSTLDLRPIGSVDQTGLRAHEDFRWLAYVATTREFGQYGAARNGDRAWSRSPDRGWAATSTDAIEDGTLDRLAVGIALAPGNRATAEDRGIEVIEGAPARRCRTAIDGETFRDAFPQVRWLIGGADLSHWRGQLDYWVFLDGQVGQIAGNLNGEGSVVEDEKLQGTIDVLMTATERDRDFVIYPPAP